MNAMSLINLNPTNKEEAKALTARLTEAVQTGEVNPLELYVKLKAMQDAIEGTMKNIRDNVMREADKYGERTFQAYTAEVQKTETGVRYDYEACNDEQWQSYRDAEQKFAEARKEREKFLQGLKEPTNIVTADGEVITIMPPVKSSTSFIKVTFK